MSHHSKQREDDLKAFNKSKPHVKKIVDLWVCGRNIGGVLHDCVVSTRSPQDAYKKWETVFK